jgi:hypothetical protein
MYHDVCRYTKVHLPPFISLLILDDVPFLSMLSYGPPGGRYVSTYLCTATKKLADQAYKSETSNTYIQVGRDSMCLVLYVFINSPEKSKTSY